MNSVASPFTLITEPTAVQRILLAEGLLDLANEIVGDGFAFVPIECPEYWSLVIAHKAPDGTVSYRVATCRKGAGPKLMASGFSAVMEDLSNRCGYNMHAKLETMTKN